MAEFPGCQLADEFKGWNKEAGGMVKTFLVEPKLDGYRLNAVIDESGWVHFYCRKPETVGWAENLKHIAQGLAATGLRNVMVDGEVMAANWNETSKLIRRKRSAMKVEIKERIRNEVKFYVFDIVDLTVPTKTGKFKPRQRKESVFHPVPLRERRARLEEIFGTTAAAPLKRGNQRGRALSAGQFPQQWSLSIVLVQQFEVVSEGELLQLADELVEMEYEGAIVKDPEMPYVFDRGFGWGKIKPVRTIELTVVGFQFGLGKHEGRLGALLCKAANGDEIAVGGGFTDEQRQTFWDRQQELVGAEIEVKVQDDSVAKARHPVFLRFRLDRNPIAVI